ncbi:MAG: DUF1616 domain-containing protein [Anaerolineales bacterium]|nr:DUF1616 domain-containing protein [Anaerolineales bacterium]
MLFLLALQTYLVFAGVESGVRAGVGVIIYAFMPGYLILSILSNDQSATMRSLELVSLSIPISIAVSTIISLISSTLLYGFNSIPQILILGLFNGTLMVVAIIKSQGTLESTAILASILMTLVVLGVVFVHSSMSSEGKQDHISMYVLPKDGNGTGNGIIVSTDEVFEVDIGVEHAIGESGDFVVRSNVFPDRKLGIGSGARSIFSYEVSLPSPGLYVLEWYLMDGESRIRSVNLWLSVGEGR